jgi:signal transduction histidine kinase
VVWKAFPFQAGAALTAFFAILLYAVLRVSRQRRVEVEARRRTESELREATAALASKEAERLRMMAEVERGQRVAALSLFAGGVAHDFNNLLAGLFGNVELARSVLPPTSPAHTHLDAAVTAFDRARDLSRRLLTFAIGSPPECRLVPIVPFLRECCSLSLSGSNCTWDVLVQEPGTPWDAHGDPNQLSQVFTNILINARQAMASGGRVRLTVRHLDPAPAQPGGPEAGRHVEITIEDSGPGMPAEVLARVFDPFYTTKPAGTGLGLALAHSIVRAHGGQIGASSPPGRGAIFTVTLPAVVAEAGPVPPAEAPPAAAGTTSGRILLMDDEPLVRGMASKMLTRGGYEVVAAPDGEEAVAQCRKALAEGRPFDAAILDVTVPGAMGGRTAMRHLRALQPDLPVVLSSGYGELETGIGEEQPTATLPKPYQMHELMACAKAVVGARG